MGKEFSMGDAPSGQFIQVDTTEGRLRGAVVLSVDNRFGGAALLPITMHPDSALLLAGALERAALKARRDEADFLAWQVRQAESGNLAQMGQVGALAKLG